MFDIQQSGLKSENRGFTAPEKLYRIGDLVRCTPFSRQTIHNYTIMGLIKESTWTQGGHRLYDESVFDKLAQIAEMRKTKNLGQILDLL
ncbi:MAG: MerR family transcriptional regulator [Phycisphaerales bacterium]